MSYGTVSGADTYHAARGNAAWAAGGATPKAAALVRATDYIRTTYVRRFSSAYDETAADVEPATYEAALRELATPGFFTKSYTEADRKVLTEVKGIKWTLTGSVRDGRSMAPTVTLIDNLLWPYMMRSYGAVTV